MHSRAAVLAVVALGGGLALLWTGAPCCVGLLAGHSGPSRSQSTVCGSAPGRRWLVSPDSIGPIPVRGLTAERLRGVCPEVAFSADRLPEAALELRAFGGSIVFLPVPAPDGRIQAIEVRTPWPRTRGGLGVGSSVGQLRSWFGPLLVVFAEGAGAVAVPRREPSGGLGFMLEHFDEVSRAGSGWVADTLRASERVPAWVRVTAIRVWPAGSRRSDRPTPRR